MVRFLFAAALVAISLSPALAGNTFAMAEDPSRSAPVPVNAAPEPDVEASVEAQAPAPVSGTAVPMPTPRPGGLLAAIIAGPAQTPPLAAVSTALPAAATPVTVPPAHARRDIVAMIEHHARLNDVPVDLVHRVVRRESNYNPAARGAGGVLGLMQIKLGTARGMGYRGDAAGLMDANENLTWGVRYLAGAYRVAGRNHDRAVSYYAAGYYYAAKAKGMLWVFRQPGLSTIASH